MRITPVTASETAFAQSIRMGVDDEIIEGDLDVPVAARGLVIFAHGSGSSRFSSRNRLVAARLRRDGLATLLIDLLTRREEQHDVRTAEHRFDIPLLARRVILAMDHTRGIEAVSRLPVGLFGASTGAAAALVAAAERPALVSAVVSRGGRPDLAGPALAQVRAPTLLIVGGDDEQVLHLNEGAYARIECARSLEVIPGASHLFEEPGTLEKAADLAASWFTRYLLEAPGEPRLGDLSAAVGRSGASRG